MKNILEEIEKNYPVNTIMVNGEQVWPYLRIAYYFEYQKGIASGKGEASYEDRAHAKQFLPRKLGILLTKLKNSLYGINNWLGKYDYIALSDASERKSIEGEYFNKLLDPVIDELGRETVLYLELPNPSLFPLKKLHTRRVACTDLLVLLSVLWQKLERKRYVIENLFILQAIQKKV